MERLVVGYGKGLIPDALMTTQMDALRTSQASLTARAEALAHTLAQLDASAQELAAATAYAGRIATRLHTLTPTEQATLLHRVVRRVIVHADTVVVDTILPTDPDPGPGSGTSTLCTTPQAQNLGPLGGHLLELRFEPRDVAQCLAQFGVWRPLVQRVGSALLLVLIFQQAPSVPTIHSSHLAHELGESGPGLTRRRRL